MSVTPELEELDKQGLQGEPHPAFTQQTNGQHGS
jgi:hypothetical protein